MMIPSEKRKERRKYKKSNLESDRQNYIVKCKTIYKLLDDSKRAYYSSRINQHKTNSKELFRLTKELMGFNGDIVLPSRTKKKELSQLFNLHFSDKIITIRTTLQSDLCNDGFSVTPPLDISF